MNNIEYVKDRRMQQASLLTRLHISTYSAGIYVVCCLFKIYVVFDNIIL